MANYEPKHVGDMVILNIQVCILISVFCWSVAICIVRSNTTFRKPHIQLSSATYEGWNFNSGNYLFTTDTK